MLDPRLVSSPYVCSFFIVLRSYVLDPRLVSSPYVCMWVILIPNEYNFLLILNSYACRIRHIIGCGRTIPKWNNP